MDRIKTFTFRKRNKFKTETNLIFPPVFEELLVEMDADAVVAGIELRLKGRALSTFPVPFVVVPLVRMEGRFVAAVEAEEGRGGLSSSHEEAERDRVNDATGELGFVFRPTGGMTLLAVAIVG